MSLREYAGILRVFPAVTCGSAGPPGVGLPAGLWGARGLQAVHLLEGAVGFVPHVVQLHGGIPLGRQVQVLLGQVGPQLPDLKLGGQRCHRGVRGSRGNHFNHSYCDSGLCSGLWFRTWLYYCHFPQPPKWRWNKSIWIQAIDDCFIHLSKTILKTFMFALASC